MDAAKSHSWSIVFGSAAVVVQCPVAQPFSHLKKAHLSAGIEIDVHSHIVPLWRLDLPTQISRYLSHITWGNTNLNLSDHFVDVMWCTPTECIYTYMCKMVLLRSHQLYTWAIHHICGGVAGQLESLFKHVLCFWVCSAGLTFQRESILQPPDVNPQLELLPLSSQVAHFRGMQWPYCSHDYNNRSERGGWLFSQSETKDDRKEVERVWPEQLWADWWNLMVPLLQGPKSR